ncbi:MAG: glycosyltransferase [Muribaculaceae bacterium]|nr:glycosyltransferase [Muribaculaceae bacterium]
MYLSPVIPDIALWLLCACFACVMLLAAIYFFRVNTVVKHRRKADAERPDKPEADYLATSVIIYSQGDADALREMLDAVLAQDYPAAYEVIVVNEGESADVRDTVSMLRATHSNLYLTFTPEGVVNLSRKKLGITLGIKAARYDIVVLTTTAAEIESPLWLRRIMRPFNKDNNIEVVLGFAYVDADEDNSYGRRRRAFDYVADSVRWLGVAIAGKPFRGTEYNIAYRKSAFFKNKGFARRLNLHNGDDDIFISEIANRNNTAVELSDESMVRLRHGNHPRIFNERVLRRLFTEHFIKRRPRLLLPLTGWLQIIAILCGVAAAVYSYPNMQAAIAAGVIIICMWALDIFIWRKAMKAMKSRRLFFTLPWLSLSYPLRRFSRHIRSRFGKQKKYTWD